jgi:hypothetical protein
MMIDEINARLENPNGTLKNLSKKFVSGLREKYNMDYEDVKSWIFCGGQADPNYENIPSQFKAYENYYKLCFPNTPFPLIEDRCICDTKLVHNCYIRENVEATSDSMLIVGSCCIEHFIDAGKVRKCTKCSSDHRNRSDNLCKKCRENIQAEERETKLVAREEKKRLKKIEREAEQERILHHQRYYFDIPYNRSKSEHNLKTLLYWNKCKWDSVVGAWWCAGNTKQIEDTLDEIPYYHIKDIEAFKDKKKNKIIEYKDKSFINTKMRDKKITFTAAVEDAKLDGLKWDADRKLWYRQY